VDIGTLPTNKSAYNSKIVRSRDEEDMGEMWNISGQQRKKGYKEFGSRTHRMRKCLRGHLLHPTCSIYPKVSSSIVYTSCSRFFYPRREASCP
jgi:hypothetical protein